MCDSSNKNSLTLEVPADGSCPAPKPQKTPRRVLHFSDGTLEEYSTDEEDGASTDALQTNNLPVINIDPKSLSWAPWFWYQTTTAGSKTLEVCDYLGESLASFFGITTPKYNFEIDHYHQMVAEEEALKKEQDLEMGGWVSKSSKEENTEARVTESPTTSQKMGGSVSKSNKEDKTEALVTEIPTTSQKY